uniref:cadherin domain-containing protein n=1 Tax=Microvirga flavescens TaxID=2249811 RepID=UPI0018E0BC8C
MSPRVIEVGTQTRATLNTARSHNHPTVEMLKDGGWVVTWQTLYEDGDLWGIYQQRYDVLGNAVGPEIRINTTTTGSQSNPAATGLHDGTWVVTWSGNGPGDTVGIFQQRYSNTGKVGGETLVNTTTAGSQSLPDTVALADGGWIVTWTGGAGSAGTYDIFQQRYSANGDKVGGETVVNTTTTNEQTNPEITAFDDGGWLVTWLSKRADDYYDLYQQRYNVDGSTVGTETKVSGTSGRAGEAVVTTLDDGGWVVAWRAPDGYFSGIFQRRYTADGVPVGEETRVNTDVFGDESNPSVTALPGGGWIMTWLDGFGTKIGYQVYAADGTPIGGNVSIVAPSGSFASPVVQSLKDGSWILAWAHTNGANVSIEQQRFRLNNDPTGVQINSGDSISISEALSPGEEIGTLSALDLDKDSPVEGFTYEIVDDAGNPIDHALFEIAGGKLKLKATAHLDYEDAALRSQTVHIKVTDSGGAVVRDTITVNLTDANEADPTNIHLNGQTHIVINESLTVGEAVGTLSATDADTQQTISYAFVDEDGNVIENTFFEIVDNQIKLKAGLDYETAAHRTHVLKIKATDSGSPARSSVQEITIDLTDVNEADPVDIKVGGAVALTFAENGEPGLDLGEITATDADTSQTITGYVLLNSDGSAVDAGFPLEIVTGRTAGTFHLKLKAGASFDHEAYPGGVFTFKIQAMDSGTPVRYGVQEITIAIADVEEAPSNLHILGGTISELAATGDEVGVFSATTDPGDFLTYRLVEDRSGAFAIENNRLVVKNGLRLDYERATTHQIKVEAKDLAGHTVEQVFTINVSDVATEITSGSEEADTIFGGKNNDQLGGGAGNDWLAGRDGNDQLNGGDGDDTLSGGYGNDVLTGGKGKDIFVFDGKLGTAKTDRKVNFDTIKDYSVKDDSIWLDNALFSKNKTL